MLKTLQGQQQHFAKNISLGLLLGLVLVSSSLAQTSARPPMPGFEQIESLDFDADSAILSYGYRIYKNNCMECHGFIGRGHVNRIMTPSIVGLTAQQIVDYMVYYRDAESYGVDLTGKALLMSRQVLAISDDEIQSLALYLSDLYGSQP